MTTVTQFEYVAFQKSSEGVHRHSNYVRITLELTKNPTSNYTLKELYQKVTFKIVFQNVRPGLLSSLFGAVR